MKPTQLLEAIKIGISAAIDNIEDPTKGIKGGLSYLIVGPPGVGKSDIVEQACAAVTHTVTTGGVIHEESVRLIISHPVVSDPVDYKGLPFVVDSVDGEKVAEFMPFGELKALMDATVPTVFFLDDLGQAPQSVQAACMQLLLARRINGHAVSDYVIFIAATNRHGDKAGVSGILEPVKSRFTAILNLEPDLDDLVAWMQANDKPPEVVQFLRFRPNMMHNWAPRREIVNSSCPRSINNVCNLLSYGVPQAMEYEMIAGAAGEEFAAEFLGFLRIYRDLPDPALVLASPDTADVPNDPATLYALVGALAHIVTDKTFDNLVAYSERIPAEFSVLMVKDAVTRDDTLVQTKGFVTWATKHTDVVI
jgi:hypothetical protein